MYDFYGSSATELLSATKLPSSTGSGFFFKNTFPFSRLQFYEKKMLPKKAYVSSVAPWKIKSWKSQGHLIHSSYAVPQML